MVFEAFLRSVQIIANHKTNHHYRLPTNYAPTYPIQRQGSLLSLLAYCFNTQPVFPRRGYNVGVQTQGRPKQNGVSPFAHPTHLSMGREVYEYPFDACWTSPYDAKVPVAPLSLCNFIFSLAQFSLQRTGLSLIDVLLARLSCASCSIPHIEIAGTPSFDVGKTLGKHGPFSCLD